MTTAIIYKILSGADWARFQADGVYPGSAHDQRDGFIHFSTAAQLPGTLAKHYAGQTRLRLLAVNAAAIAAELRWEPARDGDLFPHLYAPLPLAAVTQDWPLGLDAAGVHQLPGSLPA
jgi:uncharacterized protein (DUF952 family)